MQDKTNDGCERHNRGQYVEPNIQDMTIKQTGRYQSCIALYVECVEAKQCVRVCLCECVCV